LDDFYVAGQCGDDQEKRMEKEGKTKAPEAKASGAQKRFCPTSLDSIIEGGKRVNTFFLALKDFSLRQPRFEDGHKSPGPI
jgi:hypothetical protein